MNRNVRATPVKRTRFTIYKLHVCRDGRRNYKTIKWKLSFGSNSRQLTFTIALDHPALLSEMIRHQIEHTQRL